MFDLSLPQRISTLTLDELACLEPADFSIASKYSPVATVPSPSKSKSNVLSKFGVFGL
mgnify:FL=1